MDAWGDAAPALAEAAAASVQGLVTGASGVTRPMRLAAEVRIQPGDDETAPLHGCHARADGFDLHADVRVGTGQRERLERLCRYALRPPVSADRLTLTPQGAELMRRTFGIDVLVCPRCGGRLRLMALIDQPVIIARILTHLGLPAEVPAPARGSPVRCGESSLF